MIAVTSLNVKFSLHYAYVVVPLLTGHRQGNLAGNVAIVLGRFTLINRAACTQALDGLLSRQPVMTGYLRSFGLISQPKNIAIVEHRQYKENYGQWQKRA